MADAEALTVHIVAASPWKQAILAVLDPDSPYRPWSALDDLRPGDLVIGVLDTDPVSVLAGVGLVDDDLDVNRAITELDLVDFVFSTRPRCPRCGARRAKGAQFGMPVSPITEPWTALMGCVVTESRPRWRCGDCSNAWR